MTEDVVSGSVRGTLHLPDAPSGGVVLSHGAGSDRNSRLLIGLAEAFAASGIAAFRIDLPFRQARTGPPHPGIAERDRLSIREAAGYMRRFGTVLLAGH